MLDYKDIHLLIDQGLNTLGIFSERANLHEQVDRAFEHVIVKDINRLLNLKTTERDAIDILIAKELSIAVQSELAKEGGYYTSVVSSSFLTSEYVSVMLLSNICTTNDTGKGWYKSLSLVNYKGQSIDANKFFKVAEIEFAGYGEAKKVEYKIVPGILIDPELQEHFATSALFGKNLPIVSFKKDKVEVVYNKKDATPIEIHYYALQALPEENRLEWCKKKTLNMPVNLQHYFIDKAIAYLAIISKKEQQNIVNLKTETLT